MLRLQEQAREEPGCLSFVFAEVLADAGHFIVVQGWRDRGCIDRHFESAAFVDYQTQIAPLLVRESEMDIYLVQTELRPVDSSRLDLTHDD